MRSPGQRPLYGLDIETDTSADGLDPGVAGIVAVAVSSATADVVLTGAEDGLLGALDTYLADLEPGIVVTWNGGAFDLPFLAARAERGGVDLGLELAWDPRLDRRGRAPLPGSIGTYIAAWHSHLHLDAYRAWRALSDARTPCGLKSIARHEGLDPVEVDVTRLHELSVGEIRRYVTSDASLTRRLAERRWSEVRRFVDRLPPGGQLAFA